MSDQILIRNLPDDLKPELRRRAALAGRSAEAEARAILADYVFREDPVLCWLDEIATVPEGEPLEAPERVAGRDLVDFE
ncbi:MAG: FitA-like ribbon-helix-helix domain-containing protein [Marmoricola sp.]